MENDKDRERLNDTHVIYETGDIGRVIMSDDIVAIIAGLAVRDIEGVYSLKDASPADKSTNINARTFNKAIDVDLADGNCTVSLSLNLKYGYNIPEVTMQVQNKVKDSVENMLGCSVTAVNIQVNDLVISA